MLEREQLSQFHCAAVSSQIKEVDLTCKQIPIWVLCEDTTKWSC